MKNMLKPCTDMIEIDEIPAHAAASTAHVGRNARVLRLTLKRKWFDMIASGKKLEEYRDPSDWIYSRLLEKDGYTHRKYDVIEFKNGYGADVPTIVVKFQGWRHGTGIPKWGAMPGLRYVVILLGPVISRNDKILPANLNLSE